jgi:aminopeptidase C
MWIAIQFDRFNQVQSNQAVLHTQVDLVNYINATLSTYKNAKTVMIPKDSGHINRKMFPVVTSDKYDFYVQWFD